MMKRKTLILGGNSRIGRVLQSWGELGTQAAWQSRHGQSVPDALIFDPLADPGFLHDAAQDVCQVLCLAGPVPGRGVAATATAADLADHSRLAEAAIRVMGGKKGRVLLASSAAVYGSQAGPLQEDMPCQPLSPYGIAKVEMERRSLALGEALGVDVTLLRIGNIAGFDAILGGWRPGFTLDCFSDGRTPRRSYIGPVTLAHTLARLLMTPNLPRVLNIAQPRAVEMGALLDAAELKYATRAAPHGAIANVTLDVSRLAGFLAPNDTLKVANPIALVKEMALLEPNMNEK